MLANVEVIRLDLELGLLQRLADHAGLQRRAVLQAHFFQHSRQPVGREALHHSVLKGDVEARRAGVALAA